MNNMIINQWEDYGTCQKSSKDHRRGQWTVHLNNLDNIKKDNSCLTETGFHNIKKDAGKQLMYVSNNAD